MQSDNYHQERSNYITRGEGNIRTRVKPSDMDDDPRNRHLTMSENLQRRIRRWLKEFGKTADSRCELKEEEAG